jgi:hypothetical protein
VEYDDLSPPSAIAISFISVWVRFYNLPNMLRKEDRAMKLGAQVGQVIRVDMSFPNYIQFRVMLPLANSLLASTKVCIRGWDDIVVPIHYENIPFFCFIYGRIRHSNKECLDGEVGDGVFKYGVELRASPPKRQCEVRIQLWSTTAQFPNFKGDQHIRL